MPGEASGAPVLSIRGLSVSGGVVPLVRDFALELARGELVALSGPSGSGKTTLLRAIAGLNDPDAGEVRLRGKPAAELGWPSFRRAVLLVDQRPVLLPGSVRANLERPFSYAAADRAFDPARAEILLRKVDLAGRLDQRADTLSVGQQQRVALVRALLVEPAVLLLDEPTSALDGEAVDAVEAVVRGQAEERGLAALIVTHDAAQVARWCDRVESLPVLAATGGGRA